MMKRPVRAFWLAFAAIAAGCARGPDPRLAGDPGAPAIRMTPIGRGVTLEVLDWGGRGRALVFLAGLGNTAHVFAVFAPQFYGSLPRPWHHPSRVRRFGGGHSLVRKHPRALCARARREGTRRVGPLPRLGDSEYAVADSVVDVVPYYNELDAAGRVQAESLLTFVQGVVADSRARIAPLPQYQIVDVHDSNHYLFLQHPREVAAAMRAFLETESLPPRP